LARPIVLIPHLFRLAGVINFRKDYSPPSSPPSQPYRMPAWSDGDGGATAGCEDRERHTQQWPVGVGGRESTWARLRSECRK
jgi:hypothetical protein